MNNPNTILREAIFYKYSTFSRYIILAFILIVLSCEKINRNSFSYNEFKETLYYSDSTGGFSDLATLGMCISRWGQPEYVTAKGYIGGNGQHLPPHTIVYKWPNVFVDGKNVEVYFEIVSGYPNNIIERNMHTTIISSEMEKALKVKEFRLVQ